VNEDSFRNEGWRCRLKNCFQKEKRMSRFLQASWLLIVLGLVSVTANADLQYWLPFEDGSGNPSLTNYGTAGGSATNYTGAGTVSATTNSAVGAYAENISGTALALDGSAVPTLTTVGQSITVAAWVYLPDISGTHGIATVTRSDSSGWSFCTAGDNGPGALEARFINNSTGLWSWEYSSLHVVPNTWTFVAMTWTAGSNVSMYEYTKGTGGAVWTSSDLMAPVGPAAGWPLLVGEKSNGYGSWLNGSMDDFRVYDTALALSDIKALLPAAQITWTGTGGNTNWSTINNWTNWGSLPGTTDAVNFTLPAGGTVIPDQANQTVANATVTGSGNWNFGAGYDRWTTPTTNTLTVTNGFTFSGTGFANIYSVLAGGPLTINSGTVRLSNYNNTFTGGVYINGGTLTTDLRWVPAGSFVGSNTIYIGSTTAGNTDATLAPQVGDNTVFSNPIVVRSGNSGKAVITFTAIDNLATSWPTNAVWVGYPALTFSGPITLQKDVTLSDNAIQRDPFTESMTVSGTISGTGGVITQGQAYIDVTGNNTYTGTTQITGASQAYFTGNSTFTGPINVQGGVLYANSDASLGNSSNAVTLGDGHSIGGLGANTANTTFSRGLTLNGNGFISSRGGVGTYTGVISGSGALIIGMDGASGGTWDRNTLTKLEANNTYSGGTTVVAWGVGENGGWWGGPAYNPATYNLTSFGTGNLNIKFSGVARLTDANNVGAGAKIFVNDEGTNGGLIMGGDFVPNIDPSSSGTLIFDINRGTTGVLAASFADASHPIGNGYMFLSALGYNPIPDNGDFGNYPTSFAALVANQTPAADGSKTYFMEGNLTVNDGNAGSVNDFTKADTTNQVMNVQIGKTGVWNEQTGSAVFFRGNNGFTGTITVENNADLVGSWNGRSNFGLGTTSAVYLNGNYGGETLGIDGSFTATKGAVYFNGDSVIGLNKNGSNNGASAGPAVLAAASFNRQNRGTLGFRSSNNSLGVLEQATVTGTAPTVTNNMVAPYFWDSQNHNFLTYGDTGFTGFSPVSVTVPSIGTDSTQIVYTTGQAVSGSLAAYALHTTGALTGSGTVTVGDGTNPAGVIFATAATHTANFALGGSEGIIYVSDTSANTVVSGTISGTNGITKSGTGTLEVTGTNSGLSGSITVNQGGFTYGYDSETGSGNLVLNGGTITLGHAFNGNNQTGQQVTTNKTIDVGPNGGTLAVSAWYNGNISRPHFAGNIVDLDPSNPGPLILGGNWGLYIEGTANTYSGGTLIGGMSGVTVAANSSLGTGDVIISGYGGTFIGNSSYLYLLGDHNTGSNARLYLQADSSLVCFQSANPQIGSLEGLGYVELGTTNGSVLTTLTTGLNNKDTEFYGRIQDYSSMYGVANALTKVGTGKFTVWGPCTYTGMTTVNNGTLVNNNLISGAVTVTPGAAGQTPVYDGTGTTVGPVTVNVGGQVTGGGHFQSGLNIAGGSANLSNALVDGGMTIAGSVTAVTTTINGNLVLNSGSFTGSGTVNGNFTANAGAVVDGTTAVNGNLTIAGAAVAGAHAISGSVAISSGTFTAGAGTTIGTLHVTGTGAFAGSSAIAGAVQMDAGTIAGTHSFAGNYTQNGGTFSGGSTFGAVGSPVAVTINAGTFTGSTTVNGTFATSAGSNATVAPHNDTLSAGTMTVVGDVTLDHSTTLNFNLASPGTTGSGINDLIDITGNLSLDGTLNVNNLSGFGAGTYRLFNYTGTLSGAGLTQGVMPTPASYNYTIDTSTPNQVNLDVITPYIEGDTDHSGGSTLNSLDIDAIYHHFGQAYTTQWKVAKDTNPVGQEDVTYELTHLMHTNYGDANLDRFTDFTDFQVLLDHWQAPGGWAQGDFNGDGTVDFLDFQVLLDYWNPGGWNAGASQVPEPATLSLLALGGLALLRRSRE
jgi:autotransporter-associated beta strand protein